MKLAHVLNPTEFDVFGPDHVTDRRICLRFGEVIVPLDEVDRASFTMAGTTAQMFLLPSGEIAVSQVASWLQKHELIRLEETSFR